MNERLAAYKRGWDAALLEGEYEGQDPCPPNPYPPQSGNWHAWDDGFGDGTEWLCNGQYDY